LIRILERFNEVEKIMENEVFSVMRIVDSEDTTIYDLIELKENLKTESGSYFI